MKLNKKFKILISMSLVIMTLFINSVQVFAETVSYEANIIFNGLTVPDGNHLLTVLDTPSVSRSNTFDSDYTYNYRIDFSHSDRAVYTDGSFGNSDLNVNFTTDDEGLCYSGDYGINVNSGDYPFYFKSNYEASLGEYDEIDSSHSVGYSDDYINLYFSQVRPNIVNDYLNLEEYPYFVIRPIYSYINGYPSHLQVVILHFKYVPILDSNRISLNTFSENSINSVYGLYNDNKYFQWDTSSVSNLNSRYYVQTLLNFNLVTSVMGQNVSPFFELTNVTENYVGSTVGVYSFSESNFTPYLYDNSHNDFLTNNDITLSSFYNFDYNITSYGSSNLTTGHGGSGGSIDDPEHNGGSSDFDETDIEYLREKIASRFDFPPSPSEDNDPDNDHDIFAWISWIFAVVIQAVTGVFLVIGDVIVYITKILGSVFESILDFFNLVIQNVTNIFKMASSLFSSLPTPVSMLISASLSIFIGVFIFKLVLTIFRK